MQNPVTIHRIIDATPKRKYLSTLRGYTPLARLVEVPDWESDRSTNEENTEKPNNIEEEPEPMHVDDQAVHVEQSATKDSSVENVKSSNSEKDIPRKVFEKTNGMWKGVSDIHVFPPCKRKDTVQNSDSGENQQENRDNTNIERGHSKDAQLNVREQNSDPSGQRKPGQAEDPTNQPRSETEKFKISIPDLAFEDLEILYPDLFVEEPSGALGKKWKRLEKHRPSFAEIVEKLGLTDEDVKRVKENLVKLPKARKREDVDSFKWSDIIRHSTANKKIRKVDLSVLSLGGMRTFFKI